MVRYLTFLVLLFPAFVYGQKFLSDDPIRQDRDKLPIRRPQFIDLSPTYDTFENLFGKQGQGQGVRAQNVNTLGEVPNSSWFRNRIGMRDMTLEELVRGGSAGNGIDTENTLTVIGAGLRALSADLMVQDSRGGVYILRFDPRGLPRMATGADIIAAKFFHAMGYNVAPGSIAYIRAENLRLDDSAQVSMLGGKQKRMDQEYLDLSLAECEKDSQGRFRVASHRLPNGQPLGGFKFYGTRGDDPNDIFPHENRRELRGLRVFSAWLNHYTCSSITTMDYFIEQDEGGHVEHYLHDFMGALGSGYDLDYRIIPKNPRAGHEYTFWGDRKAALKTALSLGIWERPWMRVDYPYPKYAEIGRIEADHFEPAKWRPDYPNAAFDRMLPDDALWAAGIVARFTDEAIRAIVKTGEFSDPEAERYLVETLVKRRDRIVQHSMKEVNPLGDFRVFSSHVEFANMGETYGLSADSSYEYWWFQLNNQSSELRGLGGRETSSQTRIPLPSERPDYLMLRIRTRSETMGGWLKNVDVYLRNTGGELSVVGVEREIGVVAAERPIEAGAPVITSVAEYSGTFAGLDTDQRALALDWFRRFNEATGQALDPEVTYDSASTSTRRTFEAITHALKQTALTDRSGNSLGCALDLIEQIDLVRGKGKWVGEDLQYRIYAQLKVDAVEILRTSREFTRVADHIIFHAGYPICFRQQPTKPAIQFSISRDELYADIDVDYRDLRFPSALLQGVDISDVGAEGNYARHVRRWSGLVHWWRNFFGLPVSSQPIKLQAPDVGDLPRIPRLPRKGRGTLERAVLDFLESWLIEQRPERSLAYLSSRAFACFPSDSGTERNLAPFILLERMKGANERIGKPRRLEEVSIGIQLSNSGLRLIAHPNGDQFVLYDMPEDMASRYDCTSRNPKATPGPESSGNYGKYYASVFYLRGGGMSGETVMLVWSQEGSYWRIVSIEVEPEATEIEFPGIYLGDAFAPERVGGDSEFIAANRRFLNDWLLEGRFDEMMESFSPICYACVSQDQTGAKDFEAAGELRRRLEEVAERVQADTLQEAIEGLDPSHRDVRILAHEEEQAYSLWSLPDHIAQAFDCSRFGSKWEDPDRLVYGNYYATVLRFRVTGHDPAALFLLWQKEAGRYQIIAYHILAP